MILSVYLLGSPRIELNLSKVEFDTRKAFALLAYLISNKGMHQRDSLALLLWPDYDQNSARGALRRTLSVLKSGIPEDCLVITREQIGMSADASIWCDALEFSELINQSRVHQHPTDAVCRDCLSRLEKAAWLYKGDILSGFSVRDSPNFDEWQFFEAETYRQRLGWALERLIYLQAGINAFNESIHHARRLVHLDPLHEEAHRLLMMSYAWAGQRTAALQQYRECVRIFDKELGVPPLEETSRLYQDILEGRQLPPIIVPSKSAGAAIQVIPQSADDSIPLVGRSFESAILLRKYKNIQTDGYVIMIQGEPGIGKTRLAEEFITYVQHQGGLTFSARCFAGELNLAYAPFIEGFRLALQAHELSARLERISLADRQYAAMLVPELTTNHRLEPLSIEQSGSTAQIHFFDALRRVIFGLIEADPQDQAPPGVLFLDDFHLADTASIQLFNYLVRRLKGQRIFILLSCRNEAVPTTLLAAVSELQRARQAEVLNLNRLTKADVIELLQGKVPEAGAELEALANRLFEESEGLPFFIVEYFQAYLSGGVSDADQWQDKVQSMPLRVQDLLRSRLEELDESTWQIITTAAVIGRSFTFELIHTASGRSDMETITSLENLLRRQLIREINPAGPATPLVFDFTHDKIRQYIYEQISLVRQRILHRRVADTLEKLSKRATDYPAIASQVAMHYQLAGEFEPAARYEKQAGDQARGVFAHQDAIHHYQNALALGYLDQIELYESIGDLLTLSGEYQAALANYHSAASLAEGNHLAVLEHKVGHVYHRRGEYDLACQHYQLALQESDIKRAQIAAIHADWSLSLHAKGSEGNALEHANQSLLFAETAADPLSTAQAQNIISLLARARGEYPRALEHCLKSLQIARRLGNLSVEAAALNNLALIQSETGQIEASISSTENALTICQKIGDRHREAALLNHLAESYYTLGKPDLAMEYLKKAVLIFSDIGLDSGEPTPETWRLSEW